MVLPIRRIPLERDPFGTDGSRWFQMVSDGSRWFKMVLSKGSFGTIKSLKPPYKYIQTDIAWKLFFV
jgi:hypothetical protein